MSTPESSRRYGWIDADIRTTAVDMTRALLPSTGSLWAACREVAAQLSVHPNTVRNWYQSAPPEDPDSTHAGDLARMRERTRALEQLNADLLAALQHNRGRRHR